MFINYIINMDIVGVLLTVHNYNSNMYLSKVCV